MNKAQLFNAIRKKNSFLCVGLDSDLNKIPSHLLKEKDPIFEFNKQIIDATADLCVAYKPNTAFYEAQGASGWESLQKTLDYIPSDIFTIADAKRGDIGNTSGLYAKAFFENMAFDAITVSPYMGVDSVKPFLGYDEKWVILLALTSNAGSKDFQLLDTGGDGDKLYEKVLKKSSEWATDNSLMYVVGATNASFIKSIRKIVPGHFLLVPGIGAQGGDLQSISREGMNNECGLLVNASRSIIFAENSLQFAKKARKEASKLQNEMHQYLEEFLPDE